MLISDFKHGDLVTYIPNHAEGNKNHPDCENGVVSSVGNTFVFVKYDNAVMKMVTGDEPYTAQATKIENLIRRPMELKEARDWAADCRIIQEKHDLAKVIGTGGEVAIVLDDRITELESQKNNLPKVVCLCGSTRFSDVFRKTNMNETLAGKIVLSIGCDFKSDDTLRLSTDDKIKLDELHLKKIDLADEIYVLNVNGYIGSSTQKEIEYAIIKDKPIRYLEGEDK